MASQSQSHHDALWAKLHELELQLKLLRAARGEDAGASGCADGAGTPGAGSTTCRGRQYDAYMRRRDARRVAATVDHHQQQQLLLPGKAQQPRATRATPMSPRAARSHEAGAATPRPVVGAQAKRKPAAVPCILPAPSTPRRELPRSRTVSGVGDSPARAPSHHQRRSSLGAVAELGECATPRPFLKRGTGTGGAVAPARAARARVHDLPALDVASVVTPRPLQELAQAPRHARSVSELPLETAALASPQAARPRKRWGSPERPAAMYCAAADSHGRDLSKGLRKLLSFVRKGGRSGGGGGDQACFPAAPSPRGGGGKPVTVSKGWSSGCSLVDVPLDRGASLDGHRFPMSMTRAVGISG